MIQGSHFVADKKAAVNISEIQWTDSPCCCVNPFLSDGASMKNTKGKLFRLSLLLLLPVCVNAEQLSKEQIKGLDEQVQDIKKDVLGISAELNLLEEKLLFPSNTQLSFFVSMSDKKDGDDAEIDESYVPDAIQLKLDNQDIAHHIYSFKEVDALRRGGVQRVYTGNVRTGDHALEVLVSGKLSGDEKKSSATHKLTKGVGPQFLEIHIGKSGVQFKTW